MSLGDSRLTDCLYDISFRLVSADVARLYNCIPVIIGRLCNNSKCIAGERNGWLVSHYNSCLIFLAPPRPVAASLQTLPASYEAILWLKCRSPENVVETAKLLEASVAKCKGVGLVPREQQ